MNYSRATLIFFAWDLAWYVAGADPDTRNFGGLRIARAVTCRVWEIVVYMASEDFPVATENVGYKHFLQHIKDRLGEPPVGEVANLMDH